MKCIHPTLISDGKRSYYVPCGRCAWCRRRKQDDWFFRLSFEALKWPFVFFVTLTYDDVFVPTEAVDSDGQCRYFRGFDFVVPGDVSVTNVVYLPDVQRYFKRLTKRIGLLSGHQKFYQKLSGQFYLKPSFPDRKYICVPELGTLRSRPHYHFILFSTCDVDCSLDWSFGQVVQVPAELGSFRYVTKYILKGSQNDVRRILCSKGIGSDYINYDSEFAKLNNGDKVYLPRYLRDRWFALIDSQFLEHDISSGLVMPDAKHCKIVQEFKDGIMDELYFSDPRDEFRKSYVDLYGTLDDGFDRWLSELYLIDFRKQLKINSHGKIS